MLTRIREALYRWRVRRALSPRNAPKGWPLFILLAFLAGCAHYRQQRREIDTIRRECLTSIAASAPEHAATIEADCEHRIREVESR